MNWNIINNCLIIGKFDDKNIKIGYDIGIAGFDIDSTLISTKSGKKLAKDKNDWIFYDNCVIKKLRKYSSTHQLVFISNQKGLSGKKGDIDGWKYKIESICKKINRPILVFAGIQNDLYRKPLTGIWSEYIKCDKSKSFYCGDAGGLNDRIIKNIKVKKDFSDSDIKFARNVGVKFIHRDEFIYDVKYNNTSISNIDYPIKFESIPKGNYEFEPIDEQEIIINVGYPGSGKSYFTKNYILKCNNYECVSLDELKTKSKLIKSLKKYISEGKSVVIDNTSPSLESRKLFIDIANKNNVKCRCIKFETSFDHAFHNNMYRYVKGDRKVPIIAYRIYKKKFNEPELSEGFYQINEINFTLDENFNDPKYFQYYF